MKNTFHPFDDVNTIAQLSDLKQVTYNHTVLISTLIELLVEKKLLTREEISQKMNQLEVDMTLKLIHRSLPTSLESDN